MKSYLMILIELIEQEKDLIQCFIEGSELRGVKGLRDVLEIVRKREK